MNTARVVGPALGGVLILGDDVRLAYAAGIAIYLAALLCMLRVGPIRAQGRARNAPAWSNWVEGLHYLVRNRLVLLLLLFGLVPMFLTMPFQQLLPAFAQKVWPVGSSGLGLLSAVVGLGGVAGSLLRGVAGHRRSPAAAAARAACSASACCWSPSAGRRSSRWPWRWSSWRTSVASVFGTVNSTAIQLLIPDDLRGRVSSFLMMSYSLPLLGVLPVSYAARDVGAAGGRERRRAARDGARGRLVPAEPDATPDGPPGASLGGLERRVSRLAGAASSVGR